ncbi:pancreas/duodenum homeobox protein 1 [Phtheirospermum japonicum]|uniref:Pancreas/duodenum homeobox protein 1 n=1 Tax=Phtheirospermum japonicum TaxID=374723 RepID=A0A830D360_9LAMI|nr:pancreas/duodenum homeobox protein 1 [Phtheirospermum japonicum]
MGEDSCEMHSEEDKALQEKNKKRIVKTRAQVDALEKFYNEHKYPTEPMKLQLAVSIGLTEKQVSGWFCHRRLKDKKSINDEKFEKHGKQDRSSGVIQDRGSGYRQDSCGSTKQGDDRNMDTREVESERLTPKEFSNADVTYEHGSQYAGNYDRTDGDDPSSGSSSSLGQNGVPFDAVNSRFPVPKFHAGGEKARAGPSGYLKVKGQVENVAVTAVKRQLGKNYREDGPPLGVDFDQLPPGAFESAAEEPEEETYYAGEAVRSASPDVSKMRQNPNFSKGREFKPSMAFDDPNIDRRSHKTRPGYDIPESHTRQKFRQHASLPSSGGYYPRSNTSLELPRVSPRDIPGSESRDDDDDEYGMRPRPRVEVMRTDSFLSNPNLQPYGGIVREERADPRFRKYSGVGPKDGKTYHDRRMINENPVKVPFKNDLTAPKRTREEYSQQQYLKRSSAVDNQPHKYQAIRSREEMPSRFSEDDESAETSSSVD